MTNDRGQSSLPGKKKVHRLQLYQHRKTLMIWDAISIYLYMDRELYFTAMLFVVYIVIIIFGWLSWSKSYHQKMKTT